MKYVVDVHYQATVQFQVDAESEELATAEAMRQANEAVPYDDLYLEVVNVEEEEED